MVVGENMPSVPMVRHASSIIQIRNTMQDNAQKSLTGPSSKIGTNEKDSCRHSARLNLLKAFSRSIGDKEGQNQIVQDKNDIDIDKASGNKDNRHPLGFEIDHLNQDKDTSTI